MESVLSRTIGCGLSPGHNRTVSDGLSDRTVWIPTRMASWRLRSLWVINIESGELSINCSPPVSAPMLPSMLCAYDKVTKGRCLDSLALSDSNRSICLRILDIIGAAAVVFSNGLAGAKREKMFGINENGNKHDPVSHSKIKTNREIRILPASSRLLGCFERKFLFDFAIASFNSKFKIDFLVC